MSEDVRVIEDFLSDPDKCALYISKLLGSSGNNFSVNLSWDHRLHGRDDASFVPPPILVHDVQLADPDYCEELKNDINLKLAEKGFSNLEVNSIIYHVMLNNAWIDWHNDGNRPAALTIYLNNEWGLDKGGELLYNTDNKVERVTPSFNKAVLLRKVKHRTTPVFGNHLRKSLQVWLKEKG
jgi:hypothetical protein